jgi:hypothetical protein
MATTAKKLTERDAHRHAGLVSNFMWQDEWMEGKGDGCGEVTETAIVRSLPEEENGSPVFIVWVGGIATSGFGYSYEVERTVSVRLREDGEPLVIVATKQEIEQAEEHTMREYEQEYTELMRRVSVGAYDERQPDGSYGEDGVEKRIDRLERWAIEDGLYFAPSQQDGKTVYALEAAPQEMIDAYEAAKSEEDEEGGD